MVLRGLNVVAAQGLSDAAIYCLEVIENMTTVFTLEGFGVVGQVSKLLRGEVTANPAVVVSVPFNNFVISSQNVINAANLLDSYLANGAYTPPFVVLGMSLGSQVACEWMRRIGNASSIPAANLSFILLGNPERKYNGLIYVKNNPVYSGLGIPDNIKYQVKDYAAQYDKFADYPNGLMNRTALQNNLAGDITHVTGYFDRGLYDPDLSSFVEGNRTYVLSPTYPLPFIKGWFGTAKKDAKYRPIVESAFNRPMMVPGGGSPPSGPGFPVVTFRRRELDETQRAVRAVDGQARYWLEGHLDD